MFIESTSLQPEALDDSLSTRLVTTIDALVRLDSTGPDGESHTRTTEMPVDVIRHRGLGSPLEWVFLGNEDHHVELSLGSARELAAALTRVVAAA